VRMRIPVALFHSVRPAGGNMSARRGRTRGAISAALGLSLFGGLLSARAQQPQHESTQVVRKSEDVLRAAATSRVEPVYPPLAKAAGVPGSVEVEVTIDESGTVVSARALSGHPLLKDSAVAAALQWKFAAAKLSGAAAKVIGTITFNFVLGPESVDDSTAALEKEVRTHPDCAQVHFKLALAYNERRRVTDAIRELKETVRIDPKFGVAYLTLGECLLKEERNAEAVDALKAALRLDAHNATAHLDVGIALTKLGRYEDAIDSFKQSIKDDPAPRAAYSCLGMTCLLNERYEEAIEAFKQGIERHSESDLGPGLYYDYVSLALAYSKLNRTSEEID